ncbi:MAG: high-potential iron-sulfur protein [Woeseiaceae bacterium]|nr:high-potential iron-sulfur protein [Woeseiaceae bacterium]
MTDRYPSRESRRYFLKVASGALILPVAGLTACSGGDNAETPPAAPPAQPETAPETAAPPPAAAPEGSGLTRLEEDDPLAQALSYVHEAADVDESRFPQYEAGQTCANCAQYLGGADEEFAACAIFPGRLVKNTGWCSVYVRKPG